MVNSPPASTLSLCHSYFSTRFKAQVTCRSGDCQIPSQDGGTFLSGRGSRPEAVCRVPRPVPALAVAQREVLSWSSARGARSLSLQPWAGSAWAEVTVLPVARMAFSHVGGRKPEAVAT